MPKKPAPAPDPALTRTYSPEACLKAMGCAYCIYDPAHCGQWAPLLARTKRDGILRQCGRYDPKARALRQSAAYPIHREVT